MGQIVTLLFCIVLSCASGCFRCVFKHRQQVHCHGEYALHVFSQEVPEQMARVGKDEETHAPDRHKSATCSLSTLSPRLSFALNMANGGMEDIIDITDEENKGASKSRDGRDDYDKNDDNEDEEDTLKTWMIDAIYWYKNTLSPVMPPNCRFLPTCSTYGIQSIKEYGPIRGGVLTAWRIFRCNPFGGCGFDPPQWPPPSFRAGSNTKNWF